MRRYLCAAIGALLAVSVSATELVVIESTSPDYEPGTTITDADTIVLAEGTSIVLISEDGIVIKLPGPFDGPLTPMNEEGGYDALRALGVLVGQAEIDARSIGGVRFGGGEYDDIDPSRDAEDSRENPWLVHTGIGGNQCLPQSRGQATYWREDATRAERLNVRNLASDESAAVAWGAGEHKLAWPGDIEMSLDEIYVLRKGDELRSVALVIRSVPDAVVDSEYATVAWLAARGCTSQARLALASLQ